MLKPSNERRKKHDCNQQRVRQPSAINEDIALAREQHDATPRAVDRQFVRMKELDRSNKADDTQRRENAHDYPSRWSNPMRKCEQASPLHNRMINLTRGQDNMPNAQHAAAR